MKKHWKRLAAVAIASMMCVNAVCSPVIAAEEKEAALSEALLETAEEDGQETKAEEAEAAEETKSEETVEEAVPQETEAEAEDSEEAKTGETKTEEPGSEEAVIEETEAEESGLKETQAEETQAEETKPEETEAEETKPEEAEAEESGPKETQAEEAGPEETETKEEADGEELLEDIFAEEETDIEEAEEDAPASEPEVLLADTAMEYYMAVSELVNEAENMITFSSEGSYEDARLLVKGEPNLDFSRYEGACRVIADSEGHYTVQFSSSELAEEASGKLNALDSVEYAEPDEKIALFELEGTSATEVVNADGKVGIERASEHKSWGIGNIGADEYAAYARTISSRTIKVAVVDTGVDASHTYLEGRVLSGYDFVDNDSDPNDEHYHGTHVAGTIVDCTLELSNVKILPVRVLDSRGSGYTSSVANGVRYAADQGAEVINMSLGGGHSSVLEDAVNYAAGKGALCVVAAGNDNEPTGNACPAHIEAAVTVSAVDRNENKAYFSNYGAEVDLCAPGVDIVSCVPGGGYRSLSGTSMATPHAAACAALLKLVHASYTPEQLQDAMKNSCRDLGTAGWDSYYGCGIIELRLSLDGTDPAEISASESAVDLDLGNHSSQTVTLTVGGNLPDSYYLNYSINGSGFSCSWSGGWYNDSKNHDLLITASESGRGTITVSLMDGSSDSAVATAQIEVTVGDVSYPVGGTVTDWRYLESAHNYTNGSDYTWTYTNGEASGSMALTFSQDTRVESGYDYIYIYTSNLTGGDDILVGTYTGTQLAGQTINVSGNTVKIRLTSDSSVNYYGFKVINLEVSGVRYPEGGTVADWHDLESSHNYTSNSDYIWSYSSSENAESLNITFSSETKVENRYDHIYIYDGEEQMLGDYTGTELAGQTVNVPGNTVKIRLTSDGSVNYYGFRVSDLMPVIPDDGSETIVDDWHDLESLHSYENNCDHTWVYTCPENVEGLNVTFSEETMVESNWDHIYIYNGEGVLVGDYTGNELAGATVSVSGSTVRIRLTSDGSVTYYGFRVVNVEKIETPSEYPESEHDYANNTDQTWIWEGPEDAKNLDVTFDEQTKVESGYDHIYIYNGNDTLLGDYTGTELAGRTIRISGNTVKIRLVSDGSITFYGFKVTDILPLYAEVTVAAGDVSAYAGALIEVPVTIAENPGIAGVSLDIGYDESLLTLVSAEKGDILRDGTFSYNRNIINWYNDRNVSGDGTLFLLSFRVNSSADVCDTEISIALHGSNKNLVDEDSNFIEAVYQNGTVNINGGLTGDMTGDGDLTIGDVVYLNQYMNELVELDERQMRLADLDGNGEVGIGDVVYLYRIILGQISQPRNMVNAEAEIPQRTVHIRVGSASVQKGESISIPVEISDNCGIAGLAFSVQIPDGFVLNSITAGELLAETGSFKTDGNQVIWFHTENVTENGVLFYMNLTAGPNAASGAVSASLKDGKINNLANQNKNSIGADFEEGRMTVEEPPKNISSVSVDEIPAQLYTGNAITPAVTVRDGSAVLEKGRDYSVIYENNINVGTASVKITGLGRYTGTKTVSFMITALKQLKSIKETTIAPIVAQVYTGRPLTPSVTVKDGNKTLVQNTDYILSYKNNVNVGFGYVTITGKGAYTGYVIEIFAILDAEKPQEPEKPAVKNGDVYTASGMKYKVTSAAADGTGSVTVTGAENKNVTSVSINKTVMIEGISFKVTEIADGAFKNCTKLKTVSIGSNITRIGKEAFSGAKNLKTVKGCTAVTSIGSKAFYNCKKLTTIGSKSGTVTLAKIKTIDSSAFSGCKAVKKVNLTSKSLKTLGSSSFQGCTAMTSFTAKSTKLASIGKKAFSGDKKLASITLKTSKLTKAKVGSDAFKGIKSNCTIKVPSSKVKSYQTIFRARGAGSKVKVKK